MRRYSAARLADRRDPGGRPPTPVAVLFTLAFVPSAAAAEARAVRLTISVALPKFDIWTGGCVRYSGVICTIFEVLLLG